MKFDVAIIGGGSAGLVAAIAASRAGANVVVLEKNKKLGKKILASGNGRCNLGNQDLSLKHFVSHEPELADTVLTRFDGKAALDFFSDLGLDVVTEDGRIYPRAMQATAVLDTLQQELGRYNVIVRAECTVKDVAVKGNSYVVSCGAAETLNARRVILTTGGMAGPQLGCVGDGYKIAAGFGHTIITPTPALVGLKLKNPYAKVLSGLRTQATVAIPELNLSETGEVLFTDYGISGIPVFDLTRAVRNPQHLNLQVCLTPDIRTFSDTESLLATRFKRLAHKQVGDALIGLIPRQLVMPVLTEASIQINKLSSKLKATEINRLTRILREFTFPIVDLNTWEQAQTTSGGVPLGEVHIHSLESKLTPGLYIAGEILDVHGRCGGYNLHWAWASGYIAGRSAGTFGNL